MKIFSVILLLIFILCGCGSRKIDGQGINSSVQNCMTRSFFFEEISQDIGKAKNPDKKLPTKYTAYKADVSALKDLMTQLKGSEDKKINLPINGRCITFSLQDSEVMSPELANKYPELQSYRGFNVENRSEMASVDYDGHKIRISVNTSEGTFLLDPFEMESGIIYLMFNKIDSGVPKVPFE